MPKSQHKNATILAVMPDFKSRCHNRFKVVGLGATPDAVRRMAQMNVEREFGPFWQTAWRSVFIGHRSDVMIKFKSMTVEDLRFAVEEFRKQSATVAV